MRSGPCDAVFGEATYPPGGSYGPRVQADVQLVVADAGSIRLESDGAVLRLAAGEVVCQWPGAVEHWRFDADRPTTHRWVALSFAGADAAVLDAWAAAAPRTGAEIPALRSLSAAGLALRGDGSAGAAAARLRLAAASLRGFVEAGDAAGSDRPHGPASPAAAPRDAGPPRRPCGGAARRWSTSPPRRT